MKLRAQVAIVTGGGRAIGRAIARRFAAEGAAVTLAATSAKDIETTAAEIRASGGRALPVPTDVADEGAVERMVAATVQEFGRLDILVNNAGVGGPTAPATEMGLADWERTLAVNLTGAFLCAKHALPHLIARGGGRILNIGSVAGLAGYALRTPYAASKWGLVGLSRSLALEVGKHGITVNVIAPGPVSGKRLEGVIRDRAAAQGRSLAEVEQEFLGNLALQRAVDEEDVAATALFLASDDGRNITGETISVSGGFKV